MSLNSHCVYVDITREITKISWDKQKWELYMSKLTGCSRNSSKRKVDSYQISILTAQPNTYPQGARKRSN